MDGGYATDVQEKVATVSEDDKESLLTFNSVSVFVGTWNLHAQNPPDDLTAFIPPKAFDLYAIGTEECGQSVEVAVVYDDKTKWERQLIQHIGPDWAVVQRMTLNAIHIILFARQILLPYLTRITADSVATGLGNVIGNKG